jgi:hypothetical protein
MMIIVKQYSVDKLREREEGRRRIIIIVSDASYLEVPTTSIDILEI